MDSNHAFDGQLEGGRRCSCAHVRSDHVERYVPGKPLRTICRPCEDR